MREVEREELCVVRNGFGRIILNIETHRLYHRLRTIPQSNTIVYIVVCIIVCEYVVCESVCGMRELERVWHERESAVCEGESVCERWRESGM